MKSEFIGNAQGIGMICGHCMVYIFGKILLKQLYLLCFNQIYNKLSPISYSTTLNFKVKLLIIKYLAVKLCIKNDIFM